MSDLPRWTAQDAKARFGKLLEATLRDGPQIVTKRGAEAAVLVPIAEWRRLQAERRPGLKALLLTDEARADIPVPPRSRRPMADTDV